MIWSRPPNAQGLLCAILVDAPIGGSVLTYCGGRWQREADDERSEERPVQCCMGCWRRVLDRDMRR